MVLGLSQAGTAQSQRSDWFSPVPWNDSDWNRDSRKLHGPQKFCSTYAENEISLTFTANWDQNFVWPHTIGLFLRY